MIFEIFSHFLPSLANLGARKATFGAPGWCNYILPGWSNLAPSLIVTFTSRLLICHHCLHIIHNIKRVPTVSTSYAWIYLVGVSGEKHTLLVSLSACLFMVMMRPGQKDTNNLMF